MLALAHPIQSSDRDRPESTHSQSSSSSQPSSSKSRSQRHHEHRPPTPPADTPPQPAQRSRAFPLSPRLAPFSQPQDAHQHASSSSQSYAIGSGANQTDERKNGLDIHRYPSASLVKLLATLLQTMATSNDGLRSASAPPARTISQTCSDKDAAQCSTHLPAWHSLTTASRDALGTPSSSLAFHARHVPTISLENYLQRILKYCPTTNEVFLSILVYFERMSVLSRNTTGKEFIIDSYNVHRLVIAGITVASKFFSDIFYTNSRYAKVGGLPQAELNQLELQFLLLNDFDLAITDEEMETYARRLIDFNSQLAEPVESIPTAFSEYAAPSSSMGAYDAYRSEDAYQTDTAETEQDDGDEAYEEDTVRPSSTRSSSFA